MVAAAYSQVVATAIAVIASLDEQLTRGEAALTIAFTAHPDAVIVQSQPGLGMMRRRKVKWCCSRCHEASSLAISGNSPPTARPGRRRRGSSGRSWTSARAQVCIA